jgi:hypothetical protein
MSRSNPGLRSGGASRHGQDQAQEPDGFSRPAFGQHLEMRLGWSKKSLELIFNLGASVATIVIVE